MASRNYIDVKERLEDEKNGILEGSDDERQQIDCQGKGN